ncbi:MAG TPA: hypothetical protein VGO57_08925 [Verrucomicrobiae bacterium]
MGKTYHFQCPWCQYRAYISGGADSGDHCDIQTISCRDCRELYDVPVRLRRREPEKQLSLGKLLKPLRPELPPSVLRNGSFQPLNYPSRPLVWEQYKLACPVRPEHFIEPWQDPGRCPRCRNFMEKSGWPFRRWE